MSPEKRNEIVQRLHRGDSPETIAKDLGEPIQGVRGIKAWLTMESLRGDRRCPNCGQAVVVNLEGPQTERAIMGAVCRRLQDDGYDPKKPEQVHHEFYYPNLPQFRFIVDFKVQRNPNAMIWYIECKGQQDGAVGEVQHDVGKLVRILGLERQAKAAIVFPTGLVDIEDLEGVRNVADDRIRFLSVSEQGITEIFQNNDLPWALGA